MAANPVPENVSSSADEVFSSGSLPRELQQPLSQSATSGSGSASLTAASSITTSPEPSSIDESQASQPPAVEFSEDHVSECSKHDFGANHEEIGYGSYGVVYRVSCRNCPTIAARKDIRLPSKGDSKSREKGIQAMKDELKFLLDLKHPNIIQYLSHENAPNGLLRIYTEFCEYGDLERLIRADWEKKPLWSGNLPGRRDRIFSEQGVWDTLRQLASALAKCHHGLNSALSPNGVEEYYSFDDPCKPIIHRDIKPGNLFLKRDSVPLCGIGQETDPTDELIPNESDTICVKLGDFGTACRIKDGTVRSTVAGTKDFWAPEILEQLDERIYRVTAWSVKSDIWSVGVIMYNFLMGKFPPVKDQLESLEERVQKMTERLKKRNGQSYEGPDALIKVICECLDPEPAKRASSLDILALALKTDVSEAGLRRSESFWRTLAALPRDQNGVVAATVRHFISQYLELIDDALFSAAEACYILSLQSIFMQSDLQMTASLLNHRFYGKLEGASIFHAVAIATSRDTQLQTLVWEETKWPKLSGLVQMSLRRDKDGCLPSTVAMLEMNVPVFKALNEIEEAARAEDLSRAVDYAKKMARKEMKQETENEINFIFELLTEGKTRIVSCNREAAERALVSAASFSYDATVHKLVDLGINVNASLGRRRETALHFAASEGNETLVAFLAEHGANLQSPDYHGVVALHCAAWAGHHGAVRLLLSYGAEVNTQDHHGRTALFGAAGGGHITVVRVLLARGADRNIRGGAKKQTALERAESRGFHDVALELHGNQPRPAPDERTELPSSSLVNGRA